MTPLVESPSFSERDGGIDDADQVMALAREVILDMRRQGIDQWDEQYPDAATIRNDLTSSRTRLVLNRHSLIAYLCIDQDASPGYSGMPWRGATPAIVHRLMVHPQAQGHGLGRLLMGWAENLSKAIGYDSIRLDAFLKNPRALSLYRRLGYTQIGEVHFRKGGFAVFEKLLDA